MTSKRHASLSEVM